MSSALRLPVIWEASTARTIWEIERNRNDRGRQPASEQVKPAQAKRPPRPAENLAFYRRHTESLLNRYLYASMQVGRAPSILSDPVARGWASNRPVRTFEDAVIFVLDIERCLEKLDLIDRELISRTSLQKYTHVEAAALIGMSTRTVASRCCTALDRLTEKLLEVGLLVVPK